MINLVVIAISAMLLGVILVWWKCPALRSGAEAPKCSMLSQERRFDDHLEGLRCDFVAAGLRQRTDEERSTQSDVRVSAQRY